MKTGKIIGLVIAVWLGQAAPAQQRSSGRAEFARTWCDFGTFSAEESRTAVFPFTNRGDAPLVVTGVKTGCRCTKAEWSGKPLLPGRTDSITVGYHSREPGAFLKEIVVTTSGDPATARLHIRGYVEKSGKR